MKYMVSFQKRFFLMIFTIEVDMLIQRVALLHFSYSMTPPIEKCSDLVGIYLFYDRNHCRRFLCKIWLPAEPMGKVGGYEPIQTGKKRKSRTDLNFPNMILIVLHFLKIDHAELSLSLARWNIFCQHFSIAEVFEYSNYSKCNCMEVSKLWP